MKWLTQAEVKKAAKKSKGAAIASCKKHWKQNYTATPVEIQALARRKVASGIFRGDPCKDCPLGPDMCCGEYSKALNAFEVWAGDKTDVHFAEWQAKAKLMYDKICSL